jgi:hypothetical protein
MARIPNGINLANLNGGAQTARAQSDTLFDHLVGAGDERGRHREADRVRGLEVDDQLEFGRLQDGHVGRLFTFEHAPRVDTSEPIGRFRRAD